MKIQEKSMFYPPEKSNTYRKGLYKHCTSCCVFAILLHVTELSGGGRQCLLSAFSTICKFKSWLNFERDRETFPEGTIHFILKNEFYHSLSRIFGSRISPQFVFRKRIFSVSMRELYENISTLSMSS